jgi:hypothetical protein
MIEEKPYHKKTVTAESVQAHYAGMKLQPLEVMAQWATPEQFLGYLYCNVMKYMGRFNMIAPGKGGLPDLLKARDYLDRMIKAEEKE